MTTIRLVGRANQLGGPPWTGAGATPKFTGTLLEEVLDQQSEVYILHRQRSSASPSRADWRLPVGGAETVK
jgi:hypothetical protein